MRLYAEAMRFARGHLTGSDEGRQAKKRCLDWLAEEGAQRPERMVAVVAPGPWIGA